MNLGIRISLWDPAFSSFGYMPQIAIARSSNRDESNLTTCWICFFNFCFLLLLFTKRILSIHNGLPRGNLSLCLNVKPKCLCSGEHPDPVHLWMAARKKKLTHALPEAGHSRGYLQNLRLFNFTSPSPPPLCAIKETGIQTPIRWLFWDISLPSSRSASFPNKVVFLASTPCLQFIGLSCGNQSELGLGNRSYDNSMFKFLRNTILFFTVAALFYLPISSARGTRFPVSPQSCQTLFSFLFCSLFSFVLFFFSPFPSKSEVVSHWGFFF